MGDRGLQAVVVRGTIGSKILHVSRENPLIGRSRRSVGHRVLHDGDLLASWGTTWAIDFYHDWIGGRGHGWLGRFGYPTQVVDPFVDITPLQRPVPAPMRPHPHVRVLVC